MRGPDLVKRQEWRQRLLEFDRGEWTVAEFCRRQGCAPATFFKWRRKLGGKRGRAAAAADAVPGTGVRPRRTAGVSFVPVEITAAARVEVHLAGGAKVLVPSHDHAALRTVIAALCSAAEEGRAC
jgi:transposase-like protein